MKKRTGAQASKAPKHLAVGAHVFAGGFTVGMMKHFRVPCQLEVHNFGRETVEQSLRIPFVNEAQSGDWDNHRSVWAPGGELPSVVFGNPRCTGFSALNHGKSEEIHGASAKCTIDIWDLCNFAARNSVPVAVWESVQEATTTGKPLLDALVREVFRPKGYRIAHVLVNAAMVGNSQNRHRYFFVAYRGDLKFNVHPPMRAPAHPTLGEALARIKAIRPAEVGNLEKGPYHDDSYSKLTPEELEIAKLLEPGQTLNSWARIPANRVKLRDISTRLWVRAEYAISEMPFSAHCMVKMHADGACRTLTSGCDRLLHPTEPRPITVREMAGLMGWPPDMLAKGPLPHHQIPKGICPEVGEWLGANIVRTLDGVHGDEDFGIGEDGERYDTKGAEEKLIDLNRFAPKRPRIAT